MNDLNQIMPYLKPCPFCGCSEVYVCRNHSDLGGQCTGWVTCDNCEADGPNVFHPRNNPNPTEEEIAAAWNERQETDDHVQG